MVNFYHNFFQIQDDITYNKQQSKRHNSMQEENSVSLQALIPQPQSLKLLILHTPFTLKIDSLYRCCNLVKLDLSKNNLSYFPYLGMMTSLKFMFIHQNKLSVHDLIGIFQQEPFSNEKSALQEKIIWVTFWGNREPFNGRHYLATRTSVLAVDHHMVAMEERKSTLIHYGAIQPFHPLTAISYILANKKKFNRNTSEEEYMKQFWEDLAEVRKKDLVANPVLRLQKIFRGWYYRKTESIKKEKQIIRTKALSDVFQAWKEEYRKRKKLKVILQKKQKSYLLLPLKQMYYERALHKMKMIAREVKEKVFSRRMSYKCEHRFYGVLRSHFFAMKSLYDSLCLEASQNLLIHYENFHSFEGFVQPFFERLNPGEKLETCENDSILFRYLYEVGRKTTEIVRLRTVNLKSIAWYKPISFEKITLKNDKSLSIFKSSAFLSPLYKKNQINFSTKQKNRMKEIFQSLAKSEKLNYHELVKIPIKTQRMRKDVVRGVYFYNNGFLTQGQIPIIKINVFSEFFIKRMTSVIKIQKVWRGFWTRKTISNKIKRQFTERRASIKIQRWIRNLKWIHRKNFAFQHAKQLKSFTNGYFFIKMKDYFHIIHSVHLKKPMKFIQQHIIPYYNEQNQQITIFWNRNSSIPEVLMNYKMRKPIFSSRFIKGIFSEHQKFNFPSNDKNVEEMVPSHLFHFQTLSSIVEKRGEKYLQVKCHSKNECRLRVLALKLLSYRFWNHNSSKINIYNQDHFTETEISKKKSIVNEKSIFIRSNQNKLQLNFDDQKVEQYESSTKFYLNNQQNKKIEKFEVQLHFYLVFNKKEVMPSNREHRGSKQKKKFNSNILFDRIQIQNYLIKDTSEIRLNQIQHRTALNQKKNIQKLSKRESIKKFKLQKKKKQKPPNFLLDNYKVQDRVTTQPDLTNQRSLPEFSPKYQPLENQAKEQHNRKILKQKSEEEGNKDRNKQLQRFTKNFINQGNFIQHQHLMGYRKRIKTQFQHKALQCAENLRSQKEACRNNRFKLAEEKILRNQTFKRQHKQLIELNEKQKKDYYRMERQYISQQKRNNGPRQFRKIKISFAEECYPIKSKKRHHSQSMS